MTNTNQRLNNNYVMSHQDGTLTLKCSEDNYSSLNDREEENIKTNYKIVNVDWLDKNLVNYKIFGDKYFDKNPMKIGVINSMLNYYIKHNDKSIYK